MNIIVCIKQVPASSKVKVDPITGVLIRNGVDSKMNPYDLFAVETALYLKDKYGGTVTAVSMGPNAATTILREALYMGADRGVLISDRKFAGADVLATSYTLSSAIKSLGEYDLIICGKQTTDGDTAQVGAEMAEFLGIPHYSNVTNCEKKGDSIEFTCALGSTVMDANMTFPCLICTDSDINTPRLPSYKRKLTADKREDGITVLSLSDFADQDEKNYGLSGSPTQVEKIFPPEKNVSHITLTGDSKTLAEGIFSVLKDKKFI
jgi:electron transfer flavoprotein beta subunit